MIEKQSFLEREKNKIYNQNDFKNFLTLLKEDSLISEDDFKKLMLLVEKGELKELFEILIKYEIATWLEWPFGILLGTYFLLSDVDIYAAVFNITHGNISDFPVENLLKYLASIVPIIVLIRYTTLKILTYNTDIKNKNIFCVAGAHPLPTIITWVGAFTYFFSEYKGIYKYLRAFQKTRNEVSSILSNQNNPEKGNQLHEIWIKKVKKILDKSVIV